MVAHALTLFVGAFAAAWLVERAVLAVALRRGLLVVPDERSSHVRPTPGIGGIAFVLPVLVWSAAGAAGGYAPATLLLVGGGMLALLGLVDDLVALRARVRFPVHLAAVALALYLLPWSERLVVEPIAVDSRWLVGTIVGLGLLWLVNLYNFMDGIDGYAATQCLIVCGGVLLLAPTLEGWLFGTLALLAGATCAFLWFNWAPAQIFMGDVGSGFLGYTIGVAAAVLDGSGILPFVATMLLLTGFWFDATYTLCVRMLTRQRFADPHRSHLYQKLAARIGHSRTTVGLAVYGAVWLLPLAWLCVRLPQWQWLWVMIASVPMLALCVRFRAGLAETP